MPDDSHRPATGNSSERNDIVPGWWGALNRADLPDDLGHPRGLLTLPPTPDAPRRPRRTTLTVLLCVLVALALTAVVMVSVTSMRTVAVAALLFGVPAVLAGLVAMAVVRRGG